MLKHASRISLQRALFVTVFITVNTCLMSTYSVAAERDLSPWAIQLGAGVGSHHAYKVDLGAVWNPRLSWWDNGAWHFSVVGEAHLAQWRVVDRQNATEIGFTPVFAYSKNAGSIRPYVEAGVGIRLLSRARISDSYTLSSSFQFADMIGIGAVFGPSMRYKVGLRLQHLSNAGIKTPNPGINFAQTFFQYNF